MRCGSNVTSTHRQVRAGTDVQIPGNRPKCDELYMYGYFIAH